MSDQPHILIIELGSQYTLVIERTLRELGFRSVILEPKRAGKWITHHRVLLKAVILSGGPASVYEPDAIQPPQGVLELDVPVLGICYGMQWMVKELGGEVQPDPTHREYGPARITVMGGDYRSWLFTGLPVEQSVWASHGDSVTALPAGFKVAARNPNGGTAAFYQPEQRLMGVQFHPEVTETTHGKAMLKNFAEIVAGCNRDWKPSSLVDDIQRRAVETMGTRRGIIGFSGGVDSSTISAILTPKLGKQLLGVTIDAGNLRLHELAEIKRHAEAVGINHHVIQAADTFIPALAVTIDPEEKRKIFKGLYEKYLMEAAAQFGATFIIQGTLATDRIESGATGGDVIKSHHNVGLKFGGLERFEPVDHLFKYEVQALARALELLESIFSRHPFPGPGLFLRIVGAQMCRELLDLVRWADAETRSILERTGWYQKISQLVVAYLGVNTVGVKGDKRVLAGMLAVRAVKTHDFMTARGVYFPQDVWAEINTTLTRHPLVGRTVLDSTDKPPGTTEFE